jgi:hypothetical protein
MKGLKEVADYMRTNNRWDNRHGGNVNFMIFYDPYLNTVSVEEFTCGGQEYYKHDFIYYCFMVDEPMNEYQLETAILEKMNSVKVMDYLHPERRNRKHLKFNIKDIKAYYLY